MCSYAVARCRSGLARAFARAAPLCFSRSVANHFRRAEGSFLKKSSTMELINLSNAIGLPCRNQQIGISQWKKGLAFQQLTKERNSLRRNAFSDHLINFIVV